jgi:hypothetical protein
MPVLRPIIVFFWIAGWLSSCGPETEPDRISVRDSAGVTIVFSRFPASSEPQFYVGSPDLSIGNSVELHDVIGAVRLSDERTLRSN